ncbi:predicted protein [Naegleria gruberi]|uniref:Predicted protein n=1 Tax=Naegleria gruberi TaxID=5762 RepID=D2V2V6_NAEGR|nr:uncharacterized protein NAEGRDRAFT_63132 [Naegleria gruberi]EFC49127.1 predicted protein [Naegleria gruberi]|eukprot:XP_002681871.1 predicted protein [Naegleria gruberi strain NEG-M]
MSKRINSRIYVIDFLKLFSRLEYICGNVDLQLEHALKLTTRDLKHIDGLLIDSIPQMYNLIRTFPKYETVSFCYDIFRHSDMLETQLPVFISRFMKNTMRKLILNNVYINSTDLQSIFKQCPKLTCLSLHSNLDMRFQDNFNERSEKRPPYFDLSHIPQNRIEHLYLNGKMFLGVDKCIESSHFSLQELCLQCGGLTIGDVLTKISNVEFPKLRILKLFGHDIINDDAATCMWINLYKSCPNLEHVAITKLFKEVECQTLMDHCKKLKKIEVDGFENDNCLDICRFILY